MIIVRSIVLSTLHISVSGFYYFKYRPYFLDSLSFFFQFYHTAQATCRPGQFISFYIAVFSRFVLDFGTFMCNYFPACRNPAQPQQTAGALSDGAPPDFLNHHQTPI